MFLNNSYLITNHADSGGAIYANNTIPLLYNCLIVNNTKNTFNTKAYTYNCSIDENDSESEKSIPEKTETQHTTIKYVKDIIKQVKAVKISSNIENDLNNTDNKDTYADVNTEKTSNFNMNWIYLSIIILILGYGIWKYKSS